MRFMRVWLTAACLACTFALGAADVSAAQAQRKPKGATAQCVDGTYSRAQSQQGACSSHGGVKTWYGAEGKTARKVERTEDKAERKIARTHVFQPAGDPGCAVAKRAGDVTLVEEVVAHSYLRFTIYDLRFT